MSCFCCYAIDYDAAAALFRAATLPPLSRFFSIRLILIFDDATPPLCLMLMRFAAAAIIRLFATARHRYATPSLSATPCHYAVFAVCLRAARATAAQRATRARQRKITQHVALFYVRCC